MKIPKSFSPKHALTNYEIIQFCSMNKIPLEGIYMRNQQPLPRLENNKCYVINIDSLGHDGTHWVCVLIRKNRGIYFDSYGFHLPKELTIWIHSHSDVIKEFKRSNMLIQPIKSVACGYYVCLFMYEVMKQNKSFYDFIYQFDNEDDDDGDFKINKKFKL